MLRRVRRPVLGGETAELQDSTSERSSSWLRTRTCFLLDLVRVSGTDSAEQHDSTSDTSPSWVEPTGVHGCSGLCSLDAREHLLGSDVAGDVGPSTSLLLSSTQASARVCWPSFSACLAVLLVIRPVEGVACAAKRTRRVNGKSFASLHFGGDNYKHCERYFIFTYDLKKILCVMMTWLK